MLYKYFYTYFFPYKIFKLTGFKEANFANHSDLRVNPLISDNVLPIFKSVNISIFFLPLHYNTLWYTILLPLYFSISDKINYFQYDITQDYKHMMYLKYCFLIVLIIICVASILFKMSSLLHTSLVYFSSKISFVATDKKINLSFFPFNDHVSDL